MKLSNLRFVLKVGSLHRRLAPAVILPICVSMMTPTSQGQGIGKIYINGRELAVPPNQPDHFDFEPFKSILTSSGKEYLDCFGTAYKARYSTRDTLLIRISPSLAKWEHEIENNRIGTKQVEATITYLETSAVLGSQKPK